MIQCLECKKEFSDCKKFHMHLRGHKITQAAYYQRHLPRYDLYDGSIILFKNLESYLSHDFNSRENAIKWLKSVDKEQAKEYIKGFLLKRKEEKNLKYIPTQVELRSLPMAGMYLINYIVEDYYQFAEALGLERRFKNDVAALSFKKFEKKHKIIVDTREQRPLDFSIPTISKALKFCDYRLNDLNFSCKCFVERKSLADLYGTLSSGFERFEREILRALKARAYMVIVVESPLESVHTFIYNRQVYGKIRISPEFILHNMRELIQKYPHIQFLFTKNREESSSIIEKLFCCDGQFKNVDLQYLYDMKILN